MVSAVSASISGAKAAAVAPTQPDKVEVSRFTPSRAKISAVERQMIVVLRYDDMGKEPRPGATAGNRVIGRRRRDDRIAGSARQLLADMPDHLEATRHVIECLGDLF